MKYRMSKLKIALVIAVMLAGVIVGVVLAAEVNIDTFDAGTTQSITVLIQDDGDGNPLLPASASNRRVNANSIGGERDLILTVVDGEIEDLARWRAQSTSGYYLSLANDPNVESIARAEWDGTTDTSPATLNCATGMGSVDLVDGTNEGIAIRMEFSDTEAPLTIQLYTDCSNWAEYSIITPDDVDTGNIVDIFMPFSAFGGGAGTMDPESINAIVFIIDSTDLPGGDFQFKFVEATSYKDFGDLPDGTPYAYTTEVLNAYAVPQGLRLGDNVDTEISNTASATAAGDDGVTTDDEDGVARDMTDVWGYGASVDLRVAINGCTAGDCYFNGWIDWNQDGDFSDTYEHVFDENLISNGDNQLRTLSVPTAGNGYVLDNDLFARFQICPSAGVCNTPTITGFTNGEIEDYYWVFGPTAITLSNITARSTIPLMGVVVALAVSGVGVLFVWRRNMLRRNILRREQSQ